MGVTQVELISTTPNSFRFLVQMAAGSQSLSDVDFSLWATNGNVKAWKQIHGLSKQITH